MVRVGSEGGDLGEGRGPLLNRRGGLRFRLSHSWETALRGVPDSYISACTNDRA